MTLKIISMGWGVQSFTMAAMVATAELPPVDFVIHADTTHEHTHTYTFARQWTKWLEQRGVKVITVKDNSTSKLNLLPAFTVSNNGDGQLRRQCTGRWKIDPVRRFVASTLKKRGLKKRVGAVEQWLGITTDEFLRAKSSDVKYIVNKYPLIDLGMSRGDCLTWLQKHDLPTPQKSSCVFCPYHNAAMWKDIKRNGGADWQHALDVDCAIRDLRPPYPLFVHRARRPLSAAVSIPEDYGVCQLAFDLDDAPCDSGHCFL